MEVQVYKEQYHRDDAEMNRKVEVQECAKAERKYIDKRRLATQELYQAEDHQGQHLRPHEEQRLIAVHHIEADQGIAGGKDQVAELMSVQISQQQIHCHAAEGHVYHTDPGKHSGHGFKPRKQRQKTAETDATPGQHAPFIVSETVVQGIEPVFFPAQQAGKEQLYIEIPLCIGDGKAVLIAEGHNLEANHHQR